MQYMNNNEEELLYLVQKSLDDLYKYEKEIISNECSERNLVFHFAIYFMERFEKIKRDNELSIDLEYNRKSVEPKYIKDIKIDEKKHRIYPDLILHKRNSYEKNILAIEFKKWNNNHNIQKDIKKLKFLTDENEIYNYKLGLLIKFGKTREKVKIKKFVKGKEEIVNTIKL